MAYIIIIKQTRADQWLTTIKTPYATTVEYQVTHDMHAKLESGTWTTASKEIPTPTEAPYPPEIKWGGLYKEEQLSQPGNAHTQKQDDPHNIKTKPSPTQGANYDIHITMNDNQIPSTSAGPIEHILTNLMDLPPEIMQTIMLYLPFQDTMKLRRVNKRLWQMTEMTSLWKDITISNFPLSCGLISNAITKQVANLNIRSCLVPNPQDPDPGPP